MPLVQASQETHGPAKTGNPLKEMEHKLISRMNALDTLKTVEFKHLHQKFEELDKAFKEKIRR